MSSGILKEHRVRSGADLWLGLRCALAFLTLYPVRFAEDEEPRIKDAVEFFPLIGLAVSIPCFFFAMWLRPFFSPATLAVGVMILSAVITRALHWDALGDVADAWWGGDTPSRRQEIMSDSALGAFGVVAIVLFALANFSALTMVISNGMYALLLVAPVLARMAPVFGAWLGKAAKPEGLGASAVAKPTLEGVLIVSMSILLVSGLTIVSVGLPGLIGCLLSLLIIAGIPHVVSQRMGGVTGDVLGVGCLVGELVVYMVVVLF